MSPDDLKQHKNDPNYLFDIIINCTGVPAAIEYAINLLNVGGKFCIYGVAPEDAYVK